MKKSLIFYLIIACIVISAHPYGPWQPLSKALWPYVYAFGLDIPITPFTTDMACIYDEEQNISLYKYNFNILYSTKKGPITIPIKDLSFYKWRLPALWYIEEYYYRTDVQAPVYAMCRELEKQYGPGDGLTLVVDLPIENLKDYNFNQKIYCP